MPPNIGFLARGFEPSEIGLPQDQFAKVLQDIEARGLWDERKAEVNREGLLTFSPWGFRYLVDGGALEGLVGEPEFSMEFVPPEVAKK